MTIFNSLGSNYDFSFVLKALFTNNNDSHKSRLIEFLEKKYNGKAILLYKGREAIGLALEILNFPNQKLRAPCHPERSEGSPSKRFFGFQPQNDRDYVSVAINGFTCYAVYKAVNNAGYQAELLDLDKTLDLNFSANLLEKKVKQNPKIKAVIVQNTLGYPCDIDGIEKICRQNNLILIEDLAHCVGTKYENGKEAGTIGDLVVLSFSQDKIIDAISGGALIIRNKKYQEYYPFYSSSEGVPRSGTTEPRSLSNETMKLNNVSLKQQLIDRFYPLFTFIIRKTYKTGVGRPIHFLLRKASLLSKPMEKSFYAKYNLPNWYSYLAMYGFLNLKKNLDHRRTIATIYNSTLDKKITSEFVREDIGLSSNLRYPIFIDNRKSLINYLKKEGIYVSDVWYDDIDKNLPNCQIAANTILNLPTHKNVSEEDAKRIAEIINQWIIDNELPNKLSLRSVS